MLKMKNKFNTQKANKTQNRTLNFILGVQTSTKRSAFVNSSTNNTSSSSMILVRKTLNKTNTNRPLSSSSLDSNKQLLLHSSETRLQQNNSNNNNNMEAIPSQGVTTRPGIVASWVTTISSVPQLVTAAQTRAVLIAARKEEPIVHNRKNSGWTISSSSPAIRDSTVTDESNSQIPSTNAEDVDMEESTYFSEPSTPSVRNPTFRTERTPIRSVLNAIQGPSSPSENNSGTPKKKATNPYVLQSPWVTRFSDPQQELENPIPQALASPLQTARLTVKEILDLMCPPRNTNENAIQLDAEKTTLETNEINSQNIID